MATIANDHARTALNGDIDEYLALVRAFPLMHIRDEDHLTDALAMFEPLFVKRDQSEAEKAYLAVLTDLIEAYENATVQATERSGVDMLRYLVEENGYKQSELTPIFGVQSVASDVLSGKRAFSLEQMRKAAAFFGVRLSVFSGD